jgi:predicted transcriptional regulator
MPGGSVVPGTPGSSSFRAAYLLDGRRVTVADLIDSGLLAPGARLRFKRARRGETHHAEVTPVGHIRLDDGQTFRSPSPAATAVARGISLDGWRAWVDISSGRSLDSLRQELLDRLAVGPHDETKQVEEGISAPQHRYEFLKDARSRAAGGEPVEITVRDLLAWWGASDRSPDTGKRIEADLANHGIMSVPAFLKVTQDAKVKLLCMPEEEVGIPERLVSPIDETEEPEIGLAVGNLPSALGGVVSVQPTASFEQAITLMLLNDFSQLAVIEGQRNLRGAVTWKSIARARHANQSASFADAITDAHEVRYDKPLREVLQTLEESDFIFVRDDKNLISGIVTTADVVHAYGELATPFFLIGELDQALRRVISRTFTIEEIRPLCGLSASRVIESFDDLSMGDYQRVLENPVMWEKLGWPLDRAIFAKQLNELREIRNKVMHFNPDPLGADTKGKLRYALDLLHEYGA